MSSHCSSRAERVLSGKHQRFLPSLNIEAFLLPFLFCFQYFILIHVHVKGKTKSFINYDCFRFPRPPFLSYDGLFRLTAHVQTYSSGRLSKNKMFGAVELNERSFPEAGKSRDMQQGERFYLYYKRWCLRL